MSINLPLLRACDHLDLLAPSVFNEISNLEKLGVEAYVVRIDPNRAGGDEFCDTYGVDRRDGANCVIVEGRRGDTVTPAACLIPCGFRSDLNRVVRKALDARKVSLATKEFAVGETAMEYGSITIVGLPRGWPILIDSRLTDREQVFMGSGRVSSKLAIPGSALELLPDAVILEGLAVEAHPDPGVE